MSESRSYTVDGSSCEPLDSIIADLPESTIQVAAIKNGDKWEVSYIVPVNPKGAA